VIKPTVGRVVLYYRHGKTQFDAGEQPCAATIAYVHSDSKVNIGYLDSNGMHNPATGVRLVQEGEELPTNAFACWMPYQIEQAKAQAASAA
jgi:hypothetical protein